MNENSISGSRTVPAGYKSALLGLGGNVGDVKANLINALEFLISSKNVVVISTSPIYETPPWGIKNQPVFLNICVEISTDLKPVELLDLCHQAEQALKRERDIRWGPRTIDIDILLMEGEVVKSPDLTIPHPRILERAFVLVPLADIAPEWVLEGRTIAVWRQLCDDEGVTQVAGCEVFEGLISEVGKF